MEVEVVSREYIKPSSPTPTHLKTFHISLLDQLLPSAYVPFVFHYLMSDSNCVKQVLDRLKSSLSETLSRFYPLAGRLKDHMSFDCNDEGVLFIETHVNYDMSMFLEQPELEVLHRFVPYQDFVLEPETSLVHLAIQANVFASGGISIGVSMSHKILDANTLATFLKCWAALSAGCKDKAVFPDLTSASTLFPPRLEQLPRSMAYLKENWLKEGKSILRRFVFDSSAIKALKAKATRKLVPYPSSSQVVTALIWMRALAASTAVKGYKQPSMLVYAVNMRPRMESPLSEKAFGNIFWLTSAHHNVTHTDETELQVVVGLVKEAVKKLDSTFIQGMQGDEGFDTIHKLMEERDEVYAKEKPEMYMFSDVRSFKLSELDFGWGKPIWVSHVWGFPSSILINGVFLAERNVDEGIEAWVHLDEPEMAILEQDPEFLSYASSNPGISMPISEVGTSCVKRNYLALVALQFHSIKMEIQAVSREFIKPSSPTPSHLRTFTISLLDQLLPSAYVPIVFHYPISDASSVKQVLARLKSSLSDTLSRFYPLAGRLRNRMSFDCNDEGVLFIETRVNRYMSEFLKKPELEVLHRFVPYQDFVPEPESTLSHLAIQANVFSSGGISIGVSMSHKLLDANTLVSFLKCWTALCSGCQDQAIIPDLSSASSLFPPRSEQLPRSMAYLKESWLNEGKSILRRFVFDSNAIKGLKVKATSQLVPYPSSSQVITSLIWTRAMAASAKVKGSQHPSTLVFAVNMRPRMALPLSENAFGNIFWLTSAHHDAAHTKQNDELSVVVGRVKEAVKKLDSNFIQSMQGDEGFHNIRKLMEERDEVYAKERPGMYMVSDLRSFRLSELDFGWGKPIWVSHVWGFPSSVFVNGVFLAESSVNGGIEAWVHLDEPGMAILEQDPEFLTYASSNPGFSMPS
ncbi:uncharacterized protein LOC127811267 [Diospyros lotus]|uniref:uncharacterized protein LOC127811267 n=1 Tax=Diospyros lotus TaxID=55363 RepID=UPI0022557B45|nr:uncharacterized protein LOC127811267 [Diospyros lotus]